MVAIPAGVTTCTVVFGKDVDFAGNSAAVTVTVTPSHTLVWAATGERLVAFDVEASADEGVTGTFVVPHTDQAGFLDTAGNTITNWYYTVSARVNRGRQAKAYRKVIQPVAGQASIDLDLVADSGTVLPVGSVPTVPVTSVNGQTGNVTIQFVEDPPGSGLYVIP